MRALASRHAPLVSIHVTTFADRQFVGLCFPHAVVDAQGEAAYVRALCAELRGKPAVDLDDGVGRLEEYSRFDAAVERVVAETAGAEDADPRGAAREGGLAWGAAPLTWWNVLRVVWWQLMEWLWYRAEESGMFLGHRVVDWLVRKTKAEVAAATGGTEWVSTADVLWAWTLKAAYADEPTHGQVKDSTAVCARDLFALCTPLFPHNAVLIALSPDLPSPHATPLALLALARRRRLLATRTPAKAAALLQWSAAFRPGRFPLWLAPEHDAWLSTSHVASGLGTALDTGEGAGWAYVCVARPRGSQAAVVTSEGREGYAIQARMGRKRWASVRRALERLQGEYEAAVEAKEAGGGGASVMR